MSKFAAEFEETKVFEVLDPSGEAVLVDENDKPFTVELYAPQSERMKAYDEAATQRALMRQARVGNKPQTVAELRAVGARRIAHAIKDWHPVAPNGAHSEVDGEKARADMLADPDVRWWLTGQLIDFFDMSGFLKRKTVLTD